jgi:hypothetical protein
MKCTPFLIACCLAFAPVASARTPLSDVIDHALHDGAVATLPGPLSKALGVSRKDRPMPARQLLVRSGHAVHAFNVDPMHRHEIVLFVFDEQVKRTTGFLMTPAGRLRKVVTYREGEIPVTVPRAHADVEFSAERDAWTQDPDPISH